MWQFMSRSDMTRDNMSQLEAWRLALVACGFYHCCAGIFGFLYTKLNNLQKNLAPLKQNT